MFNKTARLVLEADSRQIKAAERDLQTFERQARQTERRAEQLGRTIGKVAGTFATGLFVRSVIKNTIEQERAVAQLNATLKSTQGVAGLASDELIQMAAGMQRVTTFGDEAVISAQSLLLTFTRVGKDVFPQALESILNVSTAMGMDLKSAALQVGKALNDPEKGLTALTRSGIQFTDAQKNTIEALVDVGRTADAQRIILAELETQFGGSARAAKNTLGGAIKSLQNAFGDLLEGDSSGGGVVSVTAAINGLTDTMNDPAVKSGFQAIVTGIFSIIDVAARGVSTLVGLSRWIGETFAASISGPAIGDLPRIEDAIAKQQQVVDQLRDNLNNARAPGQQDRISIGLERAEEDLRKLQEMRKMSEEFSSPENIPQGASAAPVVPIIPGASTKKGRSGKSAEQRAAEAIQRQIEALRVEAQTLGMTSDAARLYQLRLDGATQSQLAQASAALSTIDAYNRQKERQEELGSAFDRTAKSIISAQVSAQRSTEDLDAAQTALRDLMDSPEWDRMPIQWQETAKAMAQTASEAIKVAELQVRVNEAIKASPTAELERTRELMQGLADAYIAGRFGVVGSLEAIRHFGETANTALGNAMEKTKELDSFAKTAAENIQKSFADFLFDPFDKGLKGMLQSFGTMLQRMIAEAVAADLARKLFGQAAGGKGDGLFGKALATLGGFFGFKNSGGTVPAGGWAIAGDGGGPEIVRGPANITSTRDTAKQMGGGNTFVFNLPGIRDRKEAQESQGILQRGMLGALRGAERYV